MGIFSYKKYYLILICAVVFLYPLASVQAATFFFEPIEKRAGIGNEFSLDLMFDVDEERVNAIEGSIIYPKELVELSAIRGGDSIVNLWVEQPREEKTGEVVFSGIIPGGFEGRREPFEIQTKAGKVLSLVFRTKTAGSGTVFVADGKALLNDGLGTPTDVSSILTPIEILAYRDRALFVETDTEPPEEFTAFVEKDAEIFGGKYFIVFNAQDKGSGVAYYEVCETNSAEKESACTEKWNITQSPYVLKDQSLRSTIKIKAVDYADNERMVDIPPQGKGMATQRNSAVVIFLLAGLLAIAFFLRCRKHLFRKQ